jgi:hypothetical protein
MVVWVVSMSVRKRVHQNKVIDVGHGDAIVGVALGATGAV